MITKETIESCSNDYAEAIIKQTELMAEKKILLDRCKKYTEALYKISQIAKEGLEAK